MTVPLCKMQNDHNVPPSAHDSNKKWIMQYEFVENRGP